MTKPKLEYEWNGMSCKVCSRFQWNPDPSKEGKFLPANKCDLMGECNEYNYCPLFCPANKVSKNKVLQMWRDHSQRWIREQLLGGY